MNESISISMETIVVAAVGGLISMALAVVGYQAKMMIAQINKSIDTLFGYTYDLEKSLAELRTDHERLAAEYKVRHEK